jgi:hypothetical protein
MKKFYFLPKNCFYAYDIYANNIKEAKNKVKNILNKKTLHGVQIWQA